MQSKVVAQFLKGSSITLLGDINQATKPAALGNWRGLIQMLGISENFVLKTLEQNYRVPSDIFDYAVSYLPEPVDNGSIPSSELEGGQIDIPLDFLAENLEQTIRNVINSKDESERIAVIAEDRGVIDVSEFNPERIKVVTPEESKGLEFDHSIVVSPADWYDGSTSMARTMYVVLTRATKSITVLQRNIKRTSIKFLEN
jgi:DNA helicase IV